MSVEELAEDLMQVESLKLSLWSVPFLNAVWYNNKS